MHWVSESSGKNDGNEINLFCYELLILIVFCSLYWRPRFGKNLGLTENSNEDVICWNKMEDDVANEHFDLLTKSRSTIEGILASGRSDIWSTYGALRRAREILYRIFLHGLLAETEEVCAYLLSHCKPLPLIYVCIKQFKFLFPYRYEILNFNDSQYRCRLLFV